MATSKNVKRMARELQQLTGKPYTSCLNELEKQGEIYQHKKPDGSTEWRVTPLDGGKPT